MVKPDTLILPFDSLQESWDCYYADLLYDASEDQIVSMRNAFFAGATTAYLLMHKSIRSKTKSKSWAILQAMHNEIDDFMVEQLPTRGRA